MYDDFYSLFHRIARIVAISRFHLNFNLTFFNARYYARFLVHCSLSEIFGGKLHSIGIGCILRLNRKFFLEIKFVVNCKTILGVSKFEVGNSDITKHITIVISALVILIDLHTNVRKTRLNTTNLELFLGTHFSVSYKPFGYKLHRRFVGSPLYSIRYELLPVLFHSYL